MPTLIQPYPSATTAAGRRAALEHRINELTRTYRLRKALGQDTLKLVRRIGTLTNRWHEARNAELMES